MPICRSFVCSFLCVAIMAGFTTNLHAAPDPKKAEQFILSGIVRTIELLKGKDLPRTEVAKRLRQQLRTGFDVPTIAGFALGPLRNRITRDQRRDYLHEFEELIVQTYTNRVFNVRPRIKSISPDIIKVTSTAPIGSDQLMVYSQVNRSGANWVKINWRLRERDGRLLILDIIIVGISQATVYRSEFQSILQRTGENIEGLIAALRDKNAALRDNQR